MKVLHSICQQIWKTQQWPQDWKRSVFIPVPKKSNAKKCSNYCTVVLISHTSKVMLKILQARIQQYMNRELPDVQAAFRKGRGTRDQIANIHWKRQESSRKTSISALLTMPKPLTVWITINCGKFLTRWEYQTTWPASWEICMQVRKQELELDMEHQTGSKQEKEYIKAVLCHPDYYCVWTHFHMFIDLWIFFCEIPIQDLSISLLSCLCFPYWLTDALHRFWI